MSRPLTPLQRLVIAEAKVSPLKHLDRRHWSGRSFIFNSTPVWRLVDRGLLAFDPYAECIRPASGVEA